VAILFFLSARFQKAIQELEEENQAERRRLVASHRQRVLAR
jgi:hypothetical protein